MKQPLNITVGGVKYRRVSKFTRLDDSGRTEGPHYKVTGSRDGKLYLLSLDYMLGVNSIPAMYLLR